MTDVRLGLEVHVQLATSLKLFCADINAHTAEPNTNVCPVCLGLPGALPVLDGEAVDLALRAALALDCVVQPVSRFERKNYFYPDLPKGYQITQHTSPLARAGELSFRFAGGTRTVPLRRLHLEEDAARLLHDRFEGRTAIDMNRAGVALIEIVTEPVLESGAEARAFLTRLRQTLRYAGISACDMENGTLRVDANVSLQIGEAAGHRVEVKNLNSFAHVERAIAYEIARQREVVATGGRVAQETRSWHAARRITMPLRSKEMLEDYRYIDEPDLPPLHVAAPDLDAVRVTLPELPAERERRFADRYGLPLRDILVLTAEPDVAAFFEELAEHGADPQEAASWVRGPVLAWLNRTGSRVDSMSADRLADLLALVAAGRVSRASARFVFDRMLETGEPPARVLELSGRGQVSDEETVRAWVSAAVAGCEREVARLRAGEAQLMTYLMGQVMKVSQGRADPHIAARLLAQLVER